VQVEYREATIEGQAVGEVLIDGQVVARICTGAAGFASGERAMVVAKRLRDWTLSGANPDELTAMEGADDGAVVIAGDRIIVTITGEDGAASDATPMELAWMWRNNIAAALGGEPVLAEQEEVTEEVVAAEWVAEEPYKDKIVPIVSVLEGVRIGAARVNGPESKVDLVQAVGQLETHFRDVLEIDIYVPITTEKPGQTLHRVQGVGVTALGDYRL